MQRFCSGKGQRNRLCIACYGYAVPLEVMARLTYSAPPASLAWIDPRILVPTTTTRVGSGPGLS